MDTKQILDYYINIGKNNTKKYKIALVANVRGKTKNYVDFDSSSVINEYFSLTLTKKFNVLCVMLVTKYALFLMKMIL